MRVKMYLDADADTDTDTHCRCLWLLRWVAWLTHCCHCFNRVRVQLCSSGSLIKSVSAGTCSSLPHSRLPWPRPVQWFRNWLKLRNLIIISFLFDCCAVSSLTSAPYQVDWFVHWVGDWDTDDNTWIRSRATDAQFVSIRVWRQPPRSDRLEMRWQGRLWISKYDIPPGGA